MTIKLTLSAATLAELHALPDDAMLSTAEAAAFLHIAANSLNWYPHGVIAEMVNAQIEGAQATAKSVRWYAHDMRKKGTAVPERQRVAESEGGDAC